jgi:predicted DNA-binding ribbon-helix-helix protein
MKSPVIKRSIVIAGHKTSVSLEDAFWKALKDIALNQRTTLSDLVAAIDTQRRQGNLSSAIRLFVLEHFQARTDASGETRHGGPHTQAELAETSLAKTQLGESARPPRGVLVVAPAPAAAPSIVRPE